MEYPTSVKTKGEKSPVRSAGSPAKALMPPSITIPNVPYISTSVTSPVRSKFGPPSLNSLSRALYAPFKSIPLTGSKILSAKAAAASASTRKISDFESISIIGSGSFGVVYSMKDKATDETVVVKMMDKNDINKYFASSEYTILERLKPYCKDYILCGMEFMEDDDKYYIVSEFLGNYVSMFDYMETKKLSRKELRGIFVNVVNGLKLIHSQGVIHRDIKPENIMVNPSTLDIKYIDFGISCIDDGCSYINAAGTSTYMPPEMSFDNYIRYTKNEVIDQDYWSLGMTLVTLILQKIPQEILLNQHLDEMSKKNPTGYRMFMNDKASLLEKIKQYYESIRIKPDFPSKVVSLIRDKVYDKDKTHIETLLSLNPSDRRLPHF